MSAPPLPDLDCQLIGQFIADEFVNDHTEEHMIHLLLQMQQQTQQHQHQHQHQQQQHNQVVTPQSSKSPKTPISPTTNCTKSDTKTQESRESETQMESSKKTNNSDENTEWPKKVYEFYTKVKQNSPLIQCITNWVSMDLMANTLLAVGASPAMVHSGEEIPDFTPQAHALLINVGTLSATSLPAMKSAAVFATRYRKPWVLDPVAAGSSGFRLRACLDLVELRPTVIRGNGSEIIALSNASVGTTKGVDSLHQSTDALAAAKSLALASGAIVAVSGAVDIVTDGQKVMGVHNGVPMMQKITSTGCSVTALIAAFVAIDPTHAFEATASALSVFGIAGELGMGTAKGPASLRINLIDSLYGLDEVTIHHHAKVSPLP